MIFSPWKKRNNCPWKIKSAREKSEKWAKKWAWKTKTAREKNQKKAKKWFSRALFFSRKKKTAYYHHWVIFLGFLPNYSAGLVLTPHVPLRDGAGQCFFYPWKKVPVKTIFGLFFDFFTGTLLFSRPLFGPIFNFFTPILFFHGHFFWFFHGQ